MSTIRSEVSEEITRSAEKVAASARAIQQMEEWGIENPRIHVSLYDVEDRLFKPDSYGTPIRTALRDERESLARYQSKLAAKQDYSRYAEGVFNKVDELYKKIFLWCLENHQPEGIVFHKALLQFLAQDYENALTQIRALLDLSEQNGLNNTVISRFHFLCGQLQSEALLYGEAILSLTEAIAKDPSCKEAYFERAAVYFEIGDFEASIQDFLVSDKKEESVSRSDAALYAFALGMTSGASQGLEEAFTDFVPNLWSSLSGIGNLLWTTISHPIDTPMEYILLPAQRHPRGLN